jgi:hypothetical protein
MGIVSRLHQAAPEVQQAYRKKATSGPTELKVKKFRLGVENHEKQHIKMGKYQVIHHCY